LNTVGSGVLGDLSIIVAQAYTGLKSLRVTRKWHTITWRFYTLFFFELALLLGEGGVTINKKALDRLSDVLTASTAIEDKRKTIALNLKTWTTIGSRYYKLCSSLSSGALFLLPQLSDTTYDPHFDVQGFY
jgi:hypothetical protein